MVKKTKRFKYEAKKSAKEYVVHDEPKPAPAAIIIMRFLFIDGLSIAGSGFGSSCTTYSFADFLASYLKRFVFFTISRRQVFSLALSGNLL